MAKARRSPRYTPVDSEESEGETFEDSFADITAQYAAGKGKARDPMEGPGLAIGNAILLEKSSGEGTGDKDRKEEEEEEEEKEKEKEKEKEDDVDHKDRKEEEEEEEDDVDHLHCGERFGVQENSEHVQDGEIPRDKTHKPPALEDLRSVHPDSWKSGQSLDEPGHTEKGGEDVRDEIKEALDKKSIQSLNVNTSSEAQPSSAPTNSRDPPCCDGVYRAASTPEFATGIPSINPVAAQSVEVGLLKHRSGADEDVDDPSSKPLNDSENAVASTTATEIVYTEHLATKLTDWIRRRCFNCHSTDKTRWRGSKLNLGKVLCNKCGAYERSHSRPRPDEVRPKKLPSAPPIPVHIPVWGTYAGDVIPESSSNSLSNMNQSALPYWPQYHRPAIAPMSSYPVFGPDLLYAQTQPAAGQQRQLLGTQNYVPLDAETSGPMNDEVGNSSGVALWSTSTSATESPSIVDTSIKESAASATASQTIRAQQPLSPYSSAKYLVPTAPIPEKEIAIVPGEQAVPNESVISKIQLETNSVLTEKHAEKTLEDTKEQQEQPNLPSNVHGHATTSSSGVSSMPSVMDALDICTVQLLPGADSKLCDEPGTMMEQSYALDLDVDLEEGTIFKPCAQDITDEDGSNNRKENVDIQSDQEGKTGTFSRLSDSLSKFSPKFQLRSSPHPDVNPTPVSTTFTYLQLSAMHQALSLSSISQVAVKEFAKAGNKGTLASPISSNTLTHAAIYATNPSTSINITSNSFLVPQGDSYPCELSQAGASHDDLVSEIGSGEDTDVTADLEFQYPPSESESEKAAAVHLSSDAPFRPSLSIFTSNLKRKKNQSRYALSAQLPHVFRLPSHLRVEAASPVVLSATPGIDASVSSFDISCSADPSPLLSVELPADATSHIPSLASSTHAMASITIANPILPSVEEPPAKRARLASLAETIIIGSSEGPSQCSEKVSFKIKIKPRRERLQDEPRPEPEVASRKPRKMSTSKRGTKQRRRPEVQNEEIQGDQDMSAREFELSSGQPTELKLSSQSPPLARHVPLWLKDPIFAKTRVKLARADGTGKTLEFIEVFGDDKLRVRDGKFSRTLPLNSLRHLIPKEKNLVTPISGNMRNVPFKVQIFGEAICTARRPGYRLKTNEVDPAFATQELAQIFQPERARLKDSFDSDVQRNGTAKC